jgi:glucokinase
MSLVRVLEIGGTHVTAATVDADEHRVRERTRIALDSGASAAGILATLSAAAMTMADTIRTPWAVAIPDPFDYTRGIGLFRDVGKFDALYGVDLGRALRNAIMPPPESITFTHDTEAFLLGEWLSGAAVGARRCVAVTLGTGVGSAFLDNGTTVRAGPGVPPDGRIHRLSVDGAPLEDTVSRRAIRARYAARAGVDLDVHQIAELARHVDAAARAVLEHAFCALGRALAPAMRDFAPDVLVIGGSIAHSWDLLIGPLTAGLAEAGVRNAEIRPALNEADSAVIGAARLALVRPARESVSAAREAVLRELARPELVTRLEAYYAADSDACGTNFLDGTETQNPHAITAADLFAVASLGRAVPAAIARVLMRDTAAHAAIAACLDHLPPTVTLDEATSEALSAMRALHDAMLAAARDAELASALCARKRPELFAPLDRRTRTALRLPETEKDVWPVLRSLLRDAEVRDGLERVFGTVRRHGTRTDVYPLRQLCVVAELSDVHP